MFGVGPLALHLGCLPREFTPLLVCGGLAPRNVGLGAQMGFCNTALVVDALKLPAMGVLLRTGFFFNALARGFGVAASVFILLPLLGDCSEFRLSL